MFHKFFFCATLLVTAIATQANAAFCSRQKQHHTAAKTTLASLAEDNYDIKYIRFDLNVSDTSVYVGGHVATTAQVVASSMSNYVFELDTTLHIDSAFINGASVSVATSGALRTITLPTTLSSGAMFTATIYYKGLPPGGGGGFFNGITP